MYTTLNAIRDHGPCAYGWAKLLHHLGKTGPDDEPLAITTILDSNGLDDALWALRAVEGHDRVIRLLAVGYARQVEHLMADPRSRAALDVAERHANGEATDEELAAARGAAGDAARDAAWDAAGDAARIAAWAAAEDAAWAAAWAAAGEAPLAAAEDAARDAAGDAARDAAWAAAWDAAWDAQEQRLREVCAETCGVDEPVSDTVSRLMDYVREADAALRAATGEERAMSETTKEQRQRLLDLAHNGGRIYGLEAEALNAIVAEVARLEVENARLREALEAAWRDGFRSLSGLLDGVDEETEWLESNARAALLTPDGRSET
jgi:hypothetical protein